MHTAGKFGEFGRSSVVCQTKPFKLVLIINNILADLQTFFKKLKRVKSPNFIPTKPNFPIVQYVESGRFPGLL